MGLKPYPRGARGTVGHPLSALNLRLVLAVFGLISCAVLGVLAWRAGLIWLAVVLGVLAVAALVDAVVVQRRRVARARAEAGQRHSLFE